MAVVPANTKKCYQPLFNASGHKNISATIRIGQEIQCLLLAGFFYVHQCAYLAIIPTRRLNMSVSTTFLMFNQKRLFGLRLSHS